MHLDDSVLAFQLLSAFSQPRCNTGKRMKVTQPERMLALAHLAQVGILAHDEGVLPTQFQHHWRQV